MYLTQYDIFAIIIALLGLMFLVFTTFRANARITRDRDYWREEAIELYNEIAAKEMNYQLSCSKPKTCVFSRPRLA
jgi:hypothetical protein